VVAALTRTRGIVLVALVLLGVGWVVAPRSAPPLYDGVGFPDEPYRFVQRPPGTRVTRPPTTAVATAGITDGRNGPLNADSAESAPQVTVTIPAGMLLVPAGAAPPLKLVARPGRLSPPPGKYLWSNVYDITITPSVTFTARADLVATIILRAATAQQPLPSIARFDAGRWTSLPTSPVGQDVYAADLTGVGSFAVLGDTPQDLSSLRAGGGKSGGVSTGIFVAIGVLAVVMVLYFGGRRRRARARARGLSRAGRRS
jgi:hypothetical protein